MALLDIFKKKKKPKEVKKPREFKIEKRPKKKIIKEKAIPEKPTPKKISKLAYQVLKEPHVTEKATDLARKNQYIFKVFPQANKTQIKKAIEDLFGVKVIGVKILKVPAKRRRLGRIEGWRKGYKKAIVKIKEGQKIEVLPR
jgi:large subunit ribosomal protein L23